MCLNESSGRGQGCQPRLLPFQFTFTSTYFARVVWTPKMTSQPVSSIFSVLQCPLGLVELLLPLCCLRTSSSVCPIFFPLFTVLCKMVLARPDRRETGPYHFSLRFFTMVRRSSCGQVACLLGRLYCRAVFVEIRDNLAKAKVPREVEERVCLR